ncbi:dymeclin-like isoform X2 [Ornithodoros turicata]|uniref:dymeclin-like isoform X2 n=1 Tax=Ornithodoros turicata TaxID=34597 RepID=UPI003139ADC7
MGTTTSTLHDLTKNEHLQRLVGKDSITPNDPYWNQLLSFTIKPPRTKGDCEYLDESVKPLLHNLLTNNAASGNFGALVHVFLTRAQELKASAQCENIFIWQTYNALFIIKCIAKYFIVTITEDNVVKQFHASSEDGKHDDLLEQFINALVEIVVDVPLLDFTYPLHVEAITCLVVLLSVQMFSSHPAAKSRFYKSIMKGKCSIHALLLTKSLLQNYIRQDKCPDSYHSSSGGSIIIGLASGLWNVLTLGYGKGDGDQGNPMQDAVLAHHSLLLLLVLSNHCTSDKGLCNPYQKALFTFVNSQDSGSSVEAVPSFKLDYSKLYDTLCTTLNNDETTLLLYLLLHRNTQFRTYVLSRSNIEALLIPILKVLYDAPQKTSHHIYMSLIILLILSEDDLFNGGVHDITLKNVAWYTERSLLEISLGGLLILVVIRTIHFNMTRTRDKYLHTNCLAALANMSSHFKSLHPYVCQRFVSLFETLSKRLSRVMDQIRNNPELKPSEDEDFSTDLLQDLSILEEVLRMILEIINSCLSTQLQSNPNLLYSLLYKRQVFEPFRMHPNFQDVVHNLDTVLSYFSSRLEATDKSLSVSEVMEIIKEAALHWPTDRLKKFPDLKFRYVEESQPEDFFIPYVWTVVYKSSGIPWSQQNLILFNPNKDL